MQESDSAEAPGFSVLTSSFAPGGDLEHFLCLDLVFLLSLFFYFFFLLREKIRKETVCVF